MERVERLEKTGLPGFTRQRIICSVETKAFDHQHATYMLLARIDWNALSDGVDEPGPSPLLLYGRLNSDEDEGGGRSQLSRPRSVTVAHTHSDEATSPLSSDTGGDTPSDTALPPKVPPNRLQRRKTDGDVLSSARQPTRAATVHVKRDVAKPTASAPPPGAPQQLRPRQRRMTEGSADDGARPARSVSAFASANTPPTSDEMDDLARGSPPKEKGISRSSILGSLRRRCVCARVGCSVYVWEWGCAGILVCVRSVWCRGRWFG